MPKSGNNEYLKFIHTADLHLGSPFSGIAQMDEEIAAMLSHASYIAYKRIIDTAIENKVDFIIISGDIYDSQNQRIIEQLKFHKGLERLDAAGISVYITCGNHDPSQTWSKEIQWPESVYFLQSYEPEIKFFEKDGERLATIVGMSYRTNAITENLTLRYPERGGDWPFTIGSLHCTLGTNTGHDPYSPCSLHDLIVKGYDYWALGHIHKPSVIQRSNPAIVYPGIPQGRDIGESGPRGCYMVTVDSDSNIQTEFIETASVLWREVMISIDNIDSIDELRQKIECRLEEIRAENVTGATICRVTLTGRGAVHRELVKEGAKQELLQFFLEEETITGNAVLIERFIDNTALPIDRETIMQREDLIGDILVISEHMQQSGEIEEALLAELDTLFQNYRASTYLREIQEEELRELIKEAETYLLDNLIVEDLS